MGREGEGRKGSAIVRGGRARSAGAVATMLLGAWLGGTAGAASAAQFAVTIGTQNTTTNTVTSGIVMKELKLLEKHLPRTGKYKDATWRIDWQNFTSGPPITNGMIANRIQIGAMGDYPLLVNGATGQQQRGQETVLIAVVAYNIFGAGNGLVVHKDSPYYELADLKGKNVSVPFGSAAHGMLLQTMDARGWPQNFWSLANQSPEVGATNIQERRIDGHANFVPFAELLPYRGYARKIFDGVETRIPTFHGVVARKDFAKEHPEVVTAYVKAMMEANDWLRKDPKRAAERIAEWTKIEKEVVYIFLGPGGIHTLDPTVKPRLVDAIRTGRDVLTRLGRIKEFDVDAWVDETFVRRAFKEQGLDYDAQRMSLANYEVGGRDPHCNVPITRPKRAGQVWLESGELVGFSSPECTLGAMQRYQREGRKYSVAYLYDQSLGIKVFADQAFYVIEKAQPVQFVPFLLRKDAEAHAAKSGGRVATLKDALAAAGNGAH